MNLKWMEEFIFCSGAGAYLIGRALHSRKRVRQVEDTATAKTATAALGVTEMEGFAWPKKSGFKSRAGNQLVYYSLNVEELVKEGRGKKKTKWKTVFSKKHCLGLYLVDATGLVEVPTEKAELNLKPAEVTNWDRLGPEDQTYFMSFIGGEYIPGFPPPDSFLGLFSSTFRVVETEIRVGSPLYVLGFLTKKAVTRSAPSVVNAGQSFARTFTKDNRELIKLNGLTKFAKSVFNQESRSLRNLDSVIDRNGDGENSEQELTAAYTGAAEVAMRNSLKANTVEEEFEVHGTFESTEDCALFIADTHQEQLSKRLSQMHYFQLVSGLFLIGVAIYLGFRIWS